MPADEQDRVWMQQAIVLAKQGQYSAKPNPSVGCVIVKQGQLIAEGWHQQAGQPHAEVIALRQAGTAAQGATAYVTLEPCSHIGRTGPCVNALLKAKVARVVIAMQDPNPLVAGKGIVALEKAGLEVVVGVLGEQALALNKSFCHRMQTAKPLVFSKVAMSLDGRTAMASGESKWITGSQARSDVHQLRAKSCAILTGVASVLADDPSLTARDGIKGLVKQPVRIILDSNLTTPLNAKVVELPGSCTVLTCSSDAEKSKALQDKGCTVIKLAESSGKVDLTAAFNWLGEQNFNSVMVETGSTLNGALLAAGLLDELVVYLAPSIMGSEAKGAFGLPNITQLAKRKKLKLMSLSQLGEDLCLSYQLINH